jgi:aryl-alcohol dehydrogenase-like predicted oxidoreductase
MAGEHPLFNGIEMGIGTWAWGDRLFWGYGKGYNKADLKPAFDLCMNSGVRFFDTAESYGNGNSEIILGEFARSVENPPIIATKFMPYPWRFRRASLIGALRRSLKRLGLDQVDLYQMHWHFPPIKIETWMEAMTEAFQAGLIKAIGVSNYDVKQMRTAYDELRREGLSLASNQVEFSLLNKKVEKNGLLAECKERGVKLIAYSPLAQGALTGKYMEDRPLAGFRSVKYNRNLLRRIQPLINLLKKIGADHGGKNASQVAINWVISKGALPIPGGKNVTQIEQNLGGMGWHLEENEMALLDDLTDRLALGKEIK